jgi:hypothetical protein
VLCRSGVALPRVVLSEHRAKEQRIHQVIAWHGMSLNQPTQLHHQPSVRHMVVVYDERRMINTLARMAASA